MIRPLVIVHVVSELQYSAAFEWLSEALTRSHRFQLVVLNPAPGPLERKLQEKGVDVLSVPFTGKWSVAKAVWNLARHFRKSRPDVVHAHLLAGSVVALAAAWLAGVPRRIYTRHTSTFHHTYDRGGVKYDRLCNTLATRIVSISQAADYALIELEHVRPDKIAKIHHGFEFDRFLRHDPGAIDAVRRKWRIDERKPCVGVVARHIEWKGIQYVIPAFRKFKERCPDAQLILANAVGPYREVLMSQLSDFRKEDVVVIPFEEDAAALFQAMDIYVHVPVDPHAEAFGQTYIEALACGVPSIFTLSGVAAEFVRHETHALVVPFKDSEAVYRCMTRLWEDASLRERLGAAGRQYVVEHFDFAAMMEKLEELYHE